MMMARMTPRESPEEDQRSRDAGEENEGQDRQRDAPIERSLGGDRAR